MYAQTISSTRYRSTVHRNAASRRAMSSVRSEGATQAAALAAGVQLAPVKHLAVVLSDTEPHRDVALRAQLLTGDATVSRATLLAAGKRRGFAQWLSTAGSRLLELGADVSARVLRASLPADRTAVEPFTSADALRQAQVSDLMLVGRRRKFPWSLAPLARYARRLLRRSRTPVLVVGSRPIGTYRNVVIATDLETDSGPALAWVRRVAPDASLTFLHVYRGVFENELHAAGVPRGQIRAHRSSARRDASLGMAALLGRHRSVARSVLAHGWPVREVLRKAHELGADLIVVVKSVHAWWAEVLGASTSVEIAARADRDVLVVHDGGTMDAGDAQSAITASQHEESTEGRNNGRCDRSPQAR